MADSRCWSKEFLEDFINEYRLHTCLWKVKSQGYTNKYLKNQAYDQLVKLCKDRFPEADRAFVTKKIQSLRGCFRKELKRLTDSASADEEYIPTLWYFNLLLFTKDQETPTPSLTNRATDEGTLFLEQAMLDDEEDELDEDYKSDPMEDVARNPLQVDRYFGPPPPKVRKRKRLSVKKELIAAAHKLAELPAVEPPDNWEHFCSSVAADLRMLKDLKQQAIAQKLISEAIFWAKMGKLTAGSTISLSSATQTPITSFALSPCHSTLHSPNIKSEMEFSLDDHTSQEP